MTERVIETIKQFPEVRLILSDLNKILYLDEYSKEGVLYNFQNVIFFEGFMLLKNDPAFESDLQSFPLIQCLSSLKTLNDSFELFFGNSFLAKPLRLFPTFLLNNADPGRLIQEATHWNEIIPTHPLLPVQDITYLKLLKKCVENFSKLKEALVRTKVSYETFQKKVKTVYEKNKEEVQEELTFVYTAVDVDKIDLNNDQAVIEQSATMLLAIRKMASVMYQKLHKTSSTDYETPMVELVSDLLNFPVAESFLETFRTFEYLLRMEMQSINIRGLFLNDAMTVEIFEEASVVRKMLYPYKVN